jgi:hypothetical protein
MRGVRPRRLLYRNVSNVPPAPERWNLVDPQTILYWLRRLVALDFTVFDDLKNDPNATIPGVLIMSLAIFLSGLGGWLWWMVKDFPDSGDILLKSTLIGSLIAIGLWAAWLGVVYVILTQIFRERVYLEQLLRVMGVAAAPLALSFFIFAPGVSLAIGITSLSLMFALTGVAIQRVSGADVAKVMAANLAGFALWSAVLTLMVSTNASNVAAYAPGLFLFDVPADAETGQQPQIAP